MDSPVRGKAGIRARDVFYSVLYQVPLYKRGGKTQLSKSRHKALGTGIWDVALCCPTVAKQEHDSLVLSQSCSFDLFSHHHVRKHEEQLSEWHKDTTVKHPFIHAMCLVTLGFQEATTLPCHPGVVIPPPSILVSICPGVYPHSNIDWQKDPENKNPHSGPVLC
jgi:hypothetical protein